MTNEIFAEFGNDPISLCLEWLSEAEKSELNDPEAACLATCDADGRPGARMVLIKEIGPNGFKFHTNEESRKGRDLAENPHGALCFYWKSTRRQIRIEGPVKQTSDNESNDYFAIRPIERQIGAWASSQSRPFERKADLEEAVQKYREEFAGEDNIPRPGYWKGYRLNPEKIEFWIGQEHRVHTRFLYTKKDGGTWSATWLCP